MGSEPQQPVDTMRSLVGLAQMALNDHPEYLEAVAREVVRFLPGTLDSRDRLVNAIARLEADNARLRGAAKDSADALYRYHCVGIEGKRDWGLCVAEDECVKCTAIRALRAAIEEARDAE